MLSAETLAAAFKGADNAVIFCHGKCVDGLASSRLAQRALGAFGIVHSRIVELGHTDRVAKGAEHVTGSSAVLYVDITPYKEDLEVLRRAGCAIVIDHHPSVTERLDDLVSEMPELLHFCNVADSHCAASLVYEQFREQLADIPDIDRKIALIRNKDVWEYKVPEPWADQAPDFKSFLAWTVPPTLDLIDAVLRDVDACIEQGKLYGVQLTSKAEALISCVECVQRNEQGVGVFAVELHKNDKYDKELFVKRCNSNCDSGYHIRVMHYSKSPQGIFNVDVVRTNDSLPSVGDLCRTVFESDATKERYQGGGGHKAIGGIQVVAATYDLNHLAKAVLAADFALRAAN